MKQFISGTPWKDIRLGKLHLQTDGILPVMDAGISTPHGNLSYTIMKGNRAAVIIPVSRGLKDLQIETGNNLSIHLLWLSGTQHIAMICEDHGLEAVFWQMVEILLDRIKSGNAAEEAIELTVNEFRSLLKLPLEKNVNLEKILGLIGELFILKELCRSNLHAVSAWIGPDGASQDFKYFDTMLEVKTGFVDEPRIVHINSLHQLDCTSKQTLYLAYVCVRGEGMHSVSALVNDILNCLPASMQEVVMMQLSKLGCNDYEGNEWNDRTFELEDISIYEVQKGFPRVTVKDLPGECIPNGLSDFSYKLNLQEAASFQLSDSSGMQLLNNFCSEVII